MCCNSYSLSPQFLALLSLEFKFTPLLVLLASSPKAIGMQRNFYKPVMSHWHLARPHLSILIYCTTFPDPPSVKPRRIVAFPLSHKQHNLETRTLSVAWVLSNGFVDGGLSWQEHDMKIKNCFEYLFMSALSREAKIWDRDRRTQRRSPGAYISSPFLCGSSWLENVFGTDHSSSIVTRSEGIDPFPLLLPFSFLGKCSIFFFHPFLFAYKPCLSQIAN